MIVKLMEVEKDMVSASSLAEELDVGLQPFQSLDIAPGQSAWWMRHLSFRQKGH